MKEGEDDELERKRDVGRNAVQSVMHNSVIAHMAINSSRGFFPCAPESARLPTPEARAAPDGHRRAHAARRAHIVQTQKCKSRLSVAEPTA